MRNTGLKISGMELWTDESVERNTMWVFDKSLEQMLVTGEGLTEVKWSKEDNMTGKLYWVVLVTHPTKAEKDDGACSAVTKGPELVCAKTENDAVVLATARWHENIVLKRTEVVVVPFE